MSEDKKDKLLGRKATEDYIFKLTPAKRRLYNVLINPEFFDLTVTDICKEAEIARSTYYTYMEDKEFVDKVKEMQFNLVEADIGRVFYATLKYAIEDSRGHQDRKLLATWAGVYADKTETKIEGEVDIGSTSSILQKYLKDDGEYSLSGDEDGG